MDFKNAYANFGNLTRDQKIMAWNEAKRELDRVKQIEMDMRKNIVSHEFDTEQVGTQNVPLGNGYKLKAVVKMNYKLTTDEKALDKALDKLEDWQADRIVKWKAELSVSEYKKLSDADRKIIDSVLTTSFVSPTLELVEPKA